MKIISLAKVSGALQSSLRRFPVAVVFTIALTLFLLWLTWSDAEQRNDRLDTVMLYALSVGSLLSLSLELWAEEVKRRTANVAKVAAYVLLTLDALYLYHLPEAGFSMEIFLAHAACISTLAVSTFLLPFFRERNDLAAWNFTLHLIGSAAASWLAGLVMWGGMALLFHSLEALFGWEVCSEVFESIPIFCLQLLPTALFLGLIPEGADKHDRTGMASAFTHKVVRFLFLPLLGGYLMVLYAYVGKILVQWELPDGWVSGLVTTLMAGCILVEFLLYPANQVKKQSTFEQRVSRWLPLLILPLLVLMTVGIARRIGDYGITLRRLYLLTLNLWFYAVCIGLFACRARRIHWIPLSLAALFMLTSVLPGVNYAAITHRYLYDKVTEKITATYHGALPMSEEAYFDWLISLPPDEALAVNSRMHQLDDAFRDLRIEALIGDHANFWGARQHIYNQHAKAVHPDTIEVDGESFIMPCHLLIRSKGLHTLALAPTADSLTIVSKQDIDQILPHPLPDTLRIALPFKTNAVPDSLLIARTDLVKWENLSENPPRSIGCTRPDARFILTECELNFKNVNVTGTLSGYYAIN